MSCYVPDDSLVAFDVIPPRQYVGAKAYRKPWENFLNSVTAARVEMSELRVTTEWSVGFGYNIQHVIATDRDGKAVDFTLRTTDGYRKLKGQWLIAHEHFSVPVDLASGRADLASQP